MSVELPQSRPNVLIVTVDEWRFPPPYETEEVRQWREANFKGLKALRKHGMEFLHHRASSTACVPSRATIYTGQYGTLTGVSQTDGAAKNAFSPDVEQNKEIMMTEDFVVQYAGSTRHHFSRKTGKCQGYEVRVARTNRKFRYQKCGNDEATKAAADKFRQYESDRQGLTRILNDSVALGKEVPSDFNQWLAGFFDGDGCIKFQRKGISVSFAQSQEQGVPQVLEDIKTHYGGSVYKNPHRGAGYLQSWTLQLPVRTLLPFVRGIKPFAIVKLPQLLLAEEHLEKGHFPTVCECHSHGSEMKTLTAYMKVPVDVARVQAPYLAGLLDAEGCIMRDTVLVAQKSSPLLLQTIKEKWGGGLGYLDETSYRFPWATAACVMTLLLPYMRHKADQAAVFLEYFALKSKAVEQHGRRWISMSPSGIREEIRLLEQKIVSLKKK